MKIEMPEARLDIKWRECVPTLVRNNDSGEVCTVIRTAGEAVYFEQCGEIMYSTVSYLLSNYSIIREYNPGERLVVTA